MDLDYPHHVKCFWRIDKDTVKDVKHSSSFPGRLRAQTAEEPVQTMRLSKLGTVGVVSLDDSGCEMTIGTLRKPSNSFCSRTLFELPRS